MKLKKLIALGLATVMSASMLVGCGSNTSAFLIASKSVSAGGSNEKSWRLAVRLYAPEVPTKGRAMTLPTPCLPVSSLRAMRQYS